MGTMGESPGLLGPHLKVLQARLQFCLPNGRPIQSFQSEGSRGQTLSKPERPRGRHRLSSGALGHCT